MNLRVTGTSQLNTAIANIRRQTDQTAKYQEMISSGIRLKNASDDPAAFVSAAQARSSTRRYAVYQETITDATADLNNSVSVLTDSSNVLVKAKELAQIGINADTSPQAYEGLASEVDTLITRLMQNANTKTETGYLFGGSSSDAPPFSVATRDVNDRPATIGYSGSEKRADGIIGPNGQTVDTKYVGSDVFQKPGTDAFQALIQLRDTLRDPVLTQSEKSVALGQRLGEVDNARNSILEVVGEQSASLAGMEAIQNRLGDLSTDAKARLSDLEGTDYTDAVLKLKEFQAGFESTLAVTAKLFDNSLLQFLR